MIKVVLHGWLKDKYPEMELGAESAAEAIDAWSRQAGVEGYPVLEAVGFDTEEKLHAKTDVKELHLVPSLYGGGGVGKVIIGAVLIAASFLIPDLPIWARTALFTTGLGMVIGGAMEIFMKSPSTSKSNDPDPSKYIGSGLNTTKIGTPIGIGGGRMLAGGQYMSLAVDSTDMVFGKFPETVPA